MVKVNEIIVDTREQNPLWKARVTRNFLSEGDYTTKKLFGKAVVERKSGEDLYSSLVQGHERFKKEILRAKSKGVIIAVFVECSERAFVSKRFKDGWRRKMSSRVLAKILKTFQERRGIEFVWCKNRYDMRRKVKEWFDRKEKEFSSFFKTH
jgi:ERCC4-type nuclease